MQIVVQEGDGLVSLMAPIQAPDESLRTSTVHTVAGRLKAFYRDQELIRVEVREGAMEIPAAAIGALTWVSNGSGFKVEQTSCIAAGDTDCTIAIQKQPLT